MSIPIPPDKEGYTGRECPECGSYFKIVFGTGLKGIDHAFCPYCGHKDNASSFTTEEQIEYAKSIAFKHVANEFFRSFQQLEGLYPRQRSFINLEIKVERGDPIQIAHYTEKDLETKLICDNCTLSYAVYGVFAFCPDCGQHNSLQILSANLAVVDKLLTMAQAVDRDVQDALLESCLAKIVSAFDGYGRELCAVYAKKTADPVKAAKVSFQNVMNAKNHVQTHFGFDLASSLSTGECQDIIRLFQKRHLLSHTAGEIDDEYIAKANDPTAIKGRKVTLRQQEIVKLLDEVKRVAEHIDQQMKALFGNPT